MPLGQTVRQSLRIRTEHTAATGVIGRPIQARLLNAIFWEMTTVLSSIVLSGVERYESK